MAYDPNDEADKAIVAGLVDEATTDLKAKNAALLGEKKKLQKQITDGNADPKALEAANARIEVLEGELETNKTELGKLTKEHGKATKALEAETGVTRKLLVENGLTDALTKAKVASAFLPAVVAMLGPKVQVITKDGERKAMVGDDELGAFVTKWSQGDEGKHYISATPNGGGLAPGGRANGGGKTMTRSAFDAADQAARSAFSAEGGVVIDG